MIHFDELFVLVVQINDPNVEGQSLLQQGDPGALGVCGGAVEESENGFATAKKAGMWRRRPQPPDRRWSVVNGTSRRGTHRDRFCCHSGLGLFESWPS